MAVLYRGQLPKPVAYTIAAVIFSIFAVVLGYAIYSNVQSSRDTEETASKRYAEADNLVCPPQTNRIEDLEGSYPKFYCVGFDGKQGTMMEFDAHGRIKLIANYDKDKLQGEWTSYHPNGKIDTKGMMENDMRQGVWNQYYVNGEIRSVKTYKDSLQNGDVELYYQTGGLMAKGAFVDDLEQGPWKVYTPEGECARECTMVDGKEENCEIFIKDYQITTKSYNSGDLGAL